VTQPSHFPLEYDRGATPWLRPKSVTVVSIIGICWAVLAMLCQAGILLNSQMNSAYATSAQQPLAVPGVVAVANVVGSIVLAILLLATCIAALRIFPSTPRLALFYGVVALLFNLATTVWWMAAFDPSAVKVPPMPAQQPGATTIPAETHKAAMVYTLEAAAIGSLIVGSIMPTMMLITFGRRSIRDFYAGGFPEPAGYPSHLQAPGDFPPPPPGAWPPPPH
jgi:hypothetical protein